MDTSERLLRAAEELLQNRDDVRATQALVEAHAADIAHVLQQLPLADRATIFRSLRQDQAGDVLSELDDATLLELVRALDDVEVSMILDRMPAEHAADVVDELSSEHAEKILDLMEEEKSEEIQEILEYPEDSAGRLMSQDVVAIRETSTVEEAIQHIRKTVTEERPFGVYAVDDHQHLIGRVPLRRLLLADPRSLILGILEAEEVVSVNATMDKEEVARVVVKYDLVTVPVVDDQNRLVGTITVDDVMDVVQEEASEDIFRMAGSDAAELERRSPRQVAMLRLPWVLLTLLIEMLAGVVIHYFDQTLGKVILLASFMPVIQAISGNTGLQSVTMVVRGLATGQVQLSRWWEPLWRQAQTSAILGAVCAVVVGSIGLLWHSFTFGFVVATSMFVSVNLSGCAGTAIPMLSKRLGFDPALTAGPFETAFQDVLGVTIFLSLATLLLRWLV
ncbi:MAG: magnesium transporter [Candidatus Rokubacteria bacterium]|nr:magnesium transporter [Candidatus Rokubacteria bacterium]